MATDWMMGTVCRVALLGEPNTHRQAGLSLLFFLSFFPLIFRYTTTHSSHILFPLLLFPFSVCVCVGWLAACLVYPTAAQRQANEKRRTVMDARP